MGGACARPSCSAVAVVRIDFDGLARVVWIDDIDDLVDGRPAAALRLCRRHADRFSPPRHWDLRDLRPGAIDLTESSPDCAPHDPPVIEASPAAAPRLFATADAGPALEARSPQLSRGIRGI